MVREGDELMRTVDYSQVLPKIFAGLEPYRELGRVSGLIPELARVSPSKFGMHLYVNTGEDFGVGDHLEPFSIQSISKVLTLTLAFGVYGEKVFERVGVEPSGNPFNSLVQLEYERGRPRNPFINAGALVVADMLVTHFANPKAELLSMIRQLAQCETIDFNPRVAESELKYGDRNAALAHFLKSFQNIENDVDEVLDFYFHQCSIEMSCLQLSHCFSLFANEGVNLKSGRRWLTKSQAKRLNAVMQTCGFYDEAGEFTYKVGLPGKSGIGGGIVAVHPGHFAVATWGPRLNEKGNSVMGMKALEWLTTETGMSIF